MLYSKINIIIIYSLACLCLDEVKSDGREE